MEIRTTLVRYLHGVGQRYPMVQKLQSGRRILSRHIDIKQYYAVLDPTIQSRTARKEKPRDYKRQIPTSIEVSTPAPVTPAQAAGYPDVHLWDVAHDKELDQIDAMNAIEWLDLPEAPSAHKPTTMNKIYRYKRDSSGQVVERKARTGLRGDLMHPDIHYREDQLAKFMADKTTVMLVFAFSVRYGLKRRILDIKCAFPHEASDSPQPTYVIQPRRFNGTYAHPGRIGRPRLNLYGGKAAPFIYFRGLE